jgi:hypothetical protein
MSTPKALDLHPDRRRRRGHRVHDRGDGDRGGDHGERVGAAIASATVDVHAAIAAGCCERTAEHTHHEELPQLRKSSTGDG